jgi:hypothetical protein
MKTFFLFVIICWPFVTLGAQLMKQMNLKEDSVSTSAGYFSAFFIFICTMLVYYFAGIFELVTK